MNLRWGRRRALHDIERELGKADPRLEELFFLFTSLASGEQMPETEKIVTRPLRSASRHLRTLIAWAVTSCITGSRLLLRTWSYPMPAVPGRRDPPRG
jgi:hypothetical protein